MILRTFAVGFTGTNCYVAICKRTGQAMIIDPGFSSDEAEPFMRKVSRLTSDLKYIVNTHGHIDHTSGNGLVKEKTGASILIHKDDAVMLTDPNRNLSRLFGLSAASPQADRLLRDEDIIEVGQLAFRVIHTPGHSMGSISLLGEDIVFVGDTLFAGSIGRTDFPDSSFEMIMHSIKNRLMKLPDHVKVYPGHGPPSTIGTERRSNPFIGAIY